MNKFNLVLMIAVSTLFAACSGDKPSQGQTQPQAQQQSQDQSQQQAQPAQTQANSQQAAASSDPYMLPKNGKVIKAMHAGGYTYMQLEKDGKEFWIAATMLNVKRDDYVRWADAAVMKNFSSSTLHKTFDEILFVTNAELDQ